MKKYDDYSFLTEIKGDGEYLYDCVMRVVDLYKDEHYVMIPNATRMFFECVFLCFLGGIEYVKTDEYGNPKIKESVDEYFKNSYCSKDDEDFYKSFISSWKDCNTGSHYINTENLTHTQYKKMAQDLIYAMSGTCCWYYSRKKGKTIRFDVKPILEMTSNIDIRKKQELIIEQLQKQNNDLKNKLGVNEEIKNEIIAKEEQNTKNPVNIDEVLLNKVFDIIVYMNNCGAFATINTIANIFRGIKNTPIMSYYPMLNNCPNFNSDKDFETIILEDYINHLLDNDFITKKGDKYYLKIN